MAWKYKYPIQKDVETDEEYQQRVDAYERAEDDYIDEYIERRREE